MTFTATFEVSQTDKTFAFGKRPHLVSRVAAAVEVLMTNTNLDVLNTGRCPDCGSELFQIGPEGGAAQNIRCAQCHQCFWFSPPFTPERIADVGDGAYQRAPVNLFQETFGMIAPPKSRSFVQWFSDWWSGK